MFKIKSWILCLTLILVGGGAGMAETQAPNQYPCEKLSTQNRELTDKEKGYAARIYAQCTQTRHHISSHDYSALIELYEKSHEYLYSTDPKKKYDAYTRLKTIFEDEYTYTIANSKTTMRLGNLAETRKNIPDQLNIESGDSLLKLLIQKISVLRNDSKLVFEKAFFQKDGKEGYLLGELAIVFKEIKPPVQPTSLPSGNLGSNSSENPEPDVGKKNILPTIFEGDLIRSVLNGLFWLLILVLTVWVFWLSTQVRGQKKKINELEQKEIKELEKSLKKIQSLPSGKIGFQKKLERYSLTDKKPFLLSYILAAYETELQQRIKNEIANHSTRSHSKLVPDSISPQTVLSDTGEHPTSHHPSYPADNPYLNNNDWRTSFKPQLDPQPTSEPVQPAKYIWLSDYLHNREETVSQQNNVLHLHSSELNQQQRLKKESSFKLEESLGKTPYYYAKEIDNEYVVVPETNMRWNSSMQGMQGLEDVFSIQTQPNATHKKDLISHISEPAIIRKEPDGKWVVAAKGQLTLSSGQFR